MGDNTDDIISNDEALALATGLLMASPPGEIKEVLKDLTILCPDGLLNDQNTEKIFRDFNIKMNEVVKMDDVSVVCDAATVIDADHLFDARNNQVVKVNHLSQEIVELNVQGVDIPSKMQTHADERNALEAAIQKYVESQFIRGTTSCNVVSDDDSLIVLISGERLNLKNFWGGRWQSKFTVNLDSKELSGCVKVFIHYFEDGNVQMNTDKNIDTVTLSFTDDSLADVIASEVGKQETIVQESLEEMYVNMSNETFKDMRRVLPITRQKMDWSGAQMQLAQGFGKSK